MPPTHSLRSSHFRTNTRSCCDSMSDVSIYSRNSATNFYSIAKRTQHKSNGLSTGAAAGIGVGIAVLVIILVGLGVYIWRAKKRKRDGSSDALSSSRTRSKAQTASTFAEDVDRTRRISPKSSPWQTISSTQKEMQNADSCPPSSSGEIPGFEGGFRHNDRRGSQHMDTPNMNKSIRMVEVDENEQEMDEKPKSYEPGASRQDEGPLATKDESSASDGSSFRSYQLYNAMIEETPGNNPPEVPDAALNATPDQASDTAPTAPSPKPQTTPAPPPSTLSSITRKPLPATLPPMPPIPQSAAPSRRSSLRSQVSRRSRRRFSWVPEDGTYIVGDDDDGADGMWTFLKRPKSSKRSAH